MKAIKLGFAFGAAMLASVGVASAQQVLKLAQDSATMNTPAPGAAFAFHDAATNTDQGLNVDLLNAIGKDAGFTPQLVWDVLANVVADVTSGKADMFMMVITPERAAQVAFSDPIWVYREALVVSKNDTTAYKTWDDLKGAVMGGVNGSAYAQAMAASGLFAEVKLYPGLSDTLKAVASGQIKGAIGAEPNAIWQVEKLGLYPNVRVVHGFQARVVTPYAIAVRKTETALLMKLNASIAKLQADGTFKTIFAKYYIDFALAK